jgi:hypothetical protein
MSLETFNNIQSLDANNPTNVDLISEGDDHIRGIKHVLRYTFPKFDVPLFFSSKTVNDFFTNAEHTKSGFLLKDHLTLKDKHEYKNFTAGNVAAYSNPTNPKHVGNLSFNDNRYSNKTETIKSLGTVGKLVFLTSPTTTKDIVVTTTAGIKVSGYVHATDGLKATYLDVGTGNIKSGSIMSSSTVTCITVTSTGSQVNGSEYITGNLHVNGTISRGSDIKLKSEIKDLSANVDEIQPVSYIKHGNKEYGVIAQELRKHFPHMVKEDKKGMLGVDYTQLIPLLILEVKELKRQVLELSKIAK